MGHFDMLPDLQKCCIRSSCAEMRMIQSGQCLLRKTILSFSISVVDQGYWLALSRNIQASEDSSVGTIGESATIATVHNLVLCGWN
jgi:hypothetical protein